MRLVNDCSFDYCRGALIGFSAVTLVNAVSVSAIANPAATTVAMGSFNILSRVMHKIIRKVTQPSSKRKTDNLQTSKRQTDNRQKNSNAFPKILSVCAQILAGAAAIGIYGAVTVSQHANPIAAGSVAAFALIYFFNQKKVKRFCVDSVNTIKQKITSLFTKVFGERKDQDSSINSHPELNASFRTN